MLWWYCGRAGALLPVRFSTPTQRISLRSARSRRRRKETDVDAPRPSRRPIEAILKTPRERAEEKRQEKLDLVREQVESGSLVIRPMTKDERRRYPPKPDEPKGPAKR
jgi:hypothetical protein